MSETPRTVYVLTYSPEYETDIVGIYSTRERAEAARATLTDLPRSDRALDIEEIAIDAMNANWLRQARS